MTQPNKLLKKSHERQFNGEDWQHVAQDLCDTLPNATEEDFDFLSSSPETGCDCGFCETAPWVKPDWCSEREAV